VRVVRLLGHRDDAGAWQIRDFLKRSVIEFRWIELSTEEDCRREGSSDLKNVNLPVVELPDGTRLFGPTLRAVADRLGFVAKPKLRQYDVSIYGAGPAGLSAAVYARARDQDHRRCASSPCGGVNPITKTRVVDAAICHYALAVMTTAGWYETSGDWLYDIGLPGKSGISGGIVTVRDRYRRVAMQYLFMAEGELKLAESQGNIISKQERLVTGVMPCQRSTLDS